MIETAVIVELLLRGVAIGALLANGVSFFCGNASWHVRSAAALFFAGVIGYVLNSSPLLRDAVGVMIIPATFFSLAGSAYFWLFVVTLFADSSLTLPRISPAIVLTIVGIGGLVAHPPLRNWIWIVHNVIEIALSLHALLIIYRSWRGDLVEARRRLRGPFLAIVTIYLIALSFFEIGESIGVQAWWYGIASSVLLAVFCLAGCFIFLQTRDAVFGASTIEQQAMRVDATDAADRLNLSRLAKLMDEQALWKNEGLTVGVLAEKMGLPEHRLRRLINDHSGHRNFAAFVNARRTEAAKQILADPERARTTVAAVAFELGFGSLGPFNRAFKEATGKTPTQWRRDHLLIPEPNLKKAD